MRMNNSIHHLTSLAICAMLLSASMTYSIREDIAYPSNSLPTFMPIGSAPAAPSAEIIEYIPDYPLLFIGDSRTVGLEQALKQNGSDLSNQAFLARIGKGFHWLTSTAKEYEGFQELPHIIVINLGVNDLGNVTKYQQLYHSYRESYWKNCPLYIVSVGPVCSPCRSVTNSRITAFNQSMQTWIQTENASASAETSSIHYIDTYSYLMETGFSSPDGLHYSAATYLKIYDYILSQITESIGDGQGYLVVTK